MTQTRATCRDCGKVGLEDESDLMPGTCPACFDKRVAPVFGRARSVPALIAGLIEVGCVPDKIIPHVRTLMQQYLDGRE